MSAEEFYSFFDEEINLGEDSMDFADLLETLDNK